MRQAGRYLPAYQKIRQRYDFLTMCRTPEIAAQVTLQPVEILNVDAAILFSDILIPLIGIGFEIEFIDERGPHVRPAIRSTKDLDLVREFDKTKVSYVFETIRILRGQLKVPLIGFAASPFTLATYVIEGSSSKDFIHTKRFMFSEPAGFRRLIQALTEMTKEYLKEQIKAGVNAIQVFDTWAGVLSPDDYDTFVYPSLKSLFESLSDVPTIYYCSNVAGLAGSVIKIDASVISLDWRIDIEHACKVLNRKPIQGNLDPLILLGSDEMILSRAKRILQAAKCAKSHIFNLGHGVNINTSVDKLKMLVDFVHEFRDEEDRDA